MSTTGPNTEQEWERYNDMMMDSQALAAQPAPEAKPSGFIPRNGDPNHDMTIGPCQCGAWHKEGDLP